MNMVKLRVIASVLEVPVRYLVETVRPLANVRFRAKKCMPERDQVLADVSRWFYSFGEIEDMLNEHIPNKLDKLHKKLAVTNNDPIKSASLVRNELGVQEDGPVYSIRNLLESSGIKVGEVKLPSNTFFGLSIADKSHGPAIVINTWEKISVERWIFTAAHELGHLVLHSLDYRTEQLKELDSHEQEADRFASAFLMPNNAFDKEWNLTSGLSFVERVIKIKLIFNVSYQTVLVRLKEKYPEEANPWSRFYSQYKSRHGESLARSTEPQPLSKEIFSGLFPIDFVSCRLTKLVRKAVEKEEISVSRAAEVLEISLHEMRELMKSWV